MAIYTEKQVKALLSKVLSFSKADECECNLDGELTGNIRYARNTVSTSGATDNVALTVQSSFGKRTGVATTNVFDEASLKNVVQRSEELAKLAPENPEHTPLFGPQKYPAVTGYFTSTAKMTPEDRAKIAFDSIDPSRQNKLIAAGFFINGERFNAMMNSKGLFAYYLSTGTDFSVTIRTEDGKGSGWASADFNDVDKFDSAKVSSIAIHKSQQSVDAKEMEPGKYTVVMEPAASETMLSNLFNAMGQRAADEGRSFLSKKPAKDGDPTNKLGEKVFDERVTIYSDPQHPDVPTPAFAGDGHRVDKTYWVKNGVITTLPNTPYWAKKTNTPYHPTAYSGGGLFGGNNQFIMQGGSDSLQDMIESTRRGVLVTRLWYIRQLDPQSLMYTGLTRDGTFYIEDGKIKYPIKNFRFNESPIIMLNNIEALGEAKRINGSMVPVMKLRDFTFSSLSDAV